MVVRVLPGAASAAARAHGGMWPDGAGGVLHGACVPVECRILAWLVLDRVYISSRGWQGGPVSESLGFLGFWCFL